MCFYQIAYLCVCFCFIFKDTLMVIIIFNLYSNFRQNFIDNLTIVLIQYGHGTCIRNVYISRANLLLVLLCFQFSQSIVHIVQFTCIHDITIVCDIFFSCTAQLSTFLYFDSTLNEIYTTGS